MSRSRTQGALYFTQLDCIAAIALALWHFDLRMLPPVVCKRAANAYLFFEFTVRIPPDVTF
jgi:hypothetical protein